jgi:hypothetical protein
VRDAPRAPGIMFSPIVRICAGATFLFMLARWLLFVEVTISNKSINASTTTVRWNLDGTMRHEEVANRWNVKHRIFRYSKNRQDEASALANCRPESGDDKCYVECCVIVGGRESCEAAKPGWCSAHVDL